MHFLASRVDGLSGWGLVDVLAVEYPKPRCARAACLRLAEAVHTGVVAVRAVVLIVPGRRSHWVVQQGFPPVVDPASWWSGYAAMSTGLCGVSGLTFHDPDAPRVAEQLDPTAAVRFCHATSRPHAVVMVKLAEPTPLLVLEALRPARSQDARLLRSTLPAPEEILAAAVLVPAAARSAVRHRP